MNAKNMIRMVMVAALLLLGISSRAEDTSLLQRSYSVNLTSAQATVRSFTDAFTEQTGVVFSYESSLGGKPLGAVSVKAKDASLEGILSKAFQGKGISYEVVGNIVVLTASAPQDKEPKSRLKPVRGSVADASGEPLLGAGVLVKGTRRGTTTDVSGNWVLDAEEGETLVFSFIGFVDQEVKVGKSAVINVTLAEDANLLDDVVVVGYGTQSRKTLTTSVSKVDGRAIEGAPVSTVGDALKGKVTGLHIVSNNNLPGEAPSMLIRGGSSINRTNAPLTLVDGVERGFEDLNPNDIESIEVFKDAASTAIYGSRASNGVIYVTTKKGDAFKAPQIVFEAQVGVTTPARKWKLANSTEYLTIVRPAALMGPNASLVIDGANGPGIGNTGPTATYSTRYLVDGEAVPAGYLSMPDPIDPSKTIIYTDHDWQSDWYDTAAYNKEYIGINGGNKDMRYAASISRLHDDGMVAMSQFNNFTMHGNTSFKITKKLTAATTFDFSRNLKNPLTGDYFAALGRGIMMSPTHIGKYPDGTFATGGTNKNQQSAEFYATFYDRENSRQKFMGNINLKWDITSWLSATAQYAMFDNYYRGSYYAYGERNNTPNYISGNRSTSESRTETNRQNFQTYLTLNKKFGDHKIDGTAGYDYNYWTYYSLSTSNTGALDDKIPYLQSGGDNTSGTMSLENAEYSTALISYFGRVGYNYADRYILSATFRADGSSLFLGKNKWGYFPSVSGAWVISEEPFFPWKEKMNTLKIRASYGQTGNNDIPRTAPLGAFSTNSYAGYNTLLPSTMQNAALMWETTTQLDLGLDAGFYGDRVRLVLDYYNKVTDHLIYSITLPDTGTFGSVTSNVGSVRFRGFEAEIHTVNVRKKNFEWTTDFTYSFNRNVVLSLPEDYAYDIVDQDGNPTGEVGYRIGGYTTANGYRFGGTAVGEPLGRIWGYKVAGILQTDEEAAAALYDTQSHGYRRTDGQSIQGRKDAGDFEWVNRYGTAKTADGLEQIDATDMFLLGNVMPHSVGGLNNTVTWGKFTLNVYLDYAIGHSIYNYMKTRMVQNTLGYSNSNVDTELVAGCWRYPGDTGAKWARFFPNDADYGNRNFSRCSSFNVEDASYICLRDVSLYYDLPDSWAKKLGMKRITIGATGNTLHYFTRVSGAIGPETGIASDADGRSLYSSVQMGASNSNIMPPAAKILGNLRITF